MDALNVTENQTSRKLATIRTIDSLEPIPEADRIEVAVVGGWRVVVQKGLYKAGDKAVYLEIDSWVPHALAPFLTDPSHFPKVYEGVEGARLKTKKLRGVISQGLLLPLDEVYAYLAKPYLVKEEGVIFDFNEGDDLTVILGILKWEKPIPATMSGLVKGNFPSFIPKTDQERIQNLKNYFYGVDYYVKDANDQSIFDQDGKPVRVYRPGWIEENDVWEVTEKLDGTSCTFYLKDGVFGVCSRNLELKETEGNLYWSQAHVWKIEEKLKENNFDNLAFQGEIIGPGIQDNRYDLKTPQFFVFDVYDIEHKRYLFADERQALCTELNLLHVPKGFVKLQSVSTNYEDFIAYADSPSLLNPKTAREGVVFKRTTGERASFKVISNKFLLKTGE